MMRETYECQKGLVSIVTPVFNGETHLPAMLDSVLGQTYPQVEMILVDDGSTDGTVAIAEDCREKFAARGYGYRIVRGGHGCASAAINRGLPYVRGEYLIWPDSDDRLEPESIEKRVRFLESHPQYRCVRSLAYYFDEDTGKAAEADEKTGDLANEDLFWDILEFRTYVCCGCYMLETASFFEIYPQRRIPEYDVGQNFQMLLPFAYRHKCPTIPEKLYGVCVRQESHSRRNLTQEEEERKYRNYERLVDDIARICKIDDVPSKERIWQWKAKRRYEIALKHHHGAQALRIARQLRKCRSFRWWNLLKDTVWICFVDNEVGRRFYGIYRRIFFRDAM